MQQNVFEGFCCPVLLGAGLTPAAACGAGLGARGVRCPPGEEDRAQPCGAPQEGPRAALEAAAGVVSPSQSRMSLQQPPLIRWETLAGGGKLHGMHPEKAALPRRGAFLQPGSCGACTGTPQHAQQKLGVGTSRDSSSDAGSDGAVYRRDFSTFLSEPPLPVTDTARANKAVSQAGRKLAWLGFQRSGGSYESYGNHITIRGKRKVVITSRYQLRALPWVGFVNKSSYGKVQT